MTADKTKIIVSGVDNPAYIIVEQTDSEIRAFFKIFKRGGVHLVMHSRPPARLAINTLRKCADEIERTMNVLPEKRSGQQT